MGYQASKIAYSQVILSLLVICSIVLAFDTQKVSADASCSPIGTTSPIGPCTATSPNVVTVSARVVDPNAPPDPGPTPPSGGAGGGGGFTSNPVAAVITLSGRFAPNATITVMLSGVLTKVVATDASGYFVVSLPGLSQGLYSISLLAKDTNNNTFATSVSYSLYATTGVETFVSNIKFPPLLVLDKTLFKANETITYTVRGVPESSFEMFLDGSSTLMGRMSLAGSYPGMIDSKKKISLGKHTIKLRERYATSTYELSSPYEFFVGQADTVAFNPKGKGGCPKKGDFNSDCKVNIIDFSILAYWHNRANFPKKFDLNSDGKINVKDFSILAFYWTG